VRRFVNSGKLAEPAVYGDGEGPVGRLVPASAALREVEGRFALTELDSRHYLVRPDGYVVARLTDPGSVDDAVASALRGSPTGRKLAQ
jgi:hypothetical protein